MSTPSLSAAVTVTPPLSVDQLYTPKSTPGNVGLCLSGGGTRACCAGMGQLRALAAIQINGSSLLGQIKALSTVSGGSWLGVPYQYLPADGPADDVYLGSYDDNQGALTLDDLADVPDGNAGKPMTSVVFSLEGIAGTAVLLYETLLHFNPGNPLPANMLWQMVMSLNILDTYKLLDLDFKTGLPQDLFSATTASLQQITTANPDLASQTAYLFADQVLSTRTQRPLHLCNMGMFVNVPTFTFPLLAPVQANGLMSGIVGKPPQATDANGLPAGGGGVASFAFSSTFQSESAGTATVTQTRPWSLTDIMGTSSVAFAETVRNQIQQWEANPLLFIDWLVQEGEAIAEWIEKHLPKELQATTTALVARGKLGAEAAAAITFPDPEYLVPSYPSWPVGAAAANPTPNIFADGGSLENNGLASLLAFGGIDSVIVCVNSETPMSTAAAGIANSSGGWVSGTQIIVDDSIPPLFGYQPYDPSNGYVLYSSGNASPENQLFGQSQVFASDDFAALLAGLWAAAGSSASAPQPAIFSQSLTVQANAWFGVPAGTTPITVVWVYLNYASNWASLFNSNAPVQQAIAAEVQNNTFPHYNTLTTELSATQVNLLAHFSSWALYSTEQSTQVFSRLFSPGA